MTTPAEPTFTELHTGLARIRRRRWYLWSALLIYLPAMMLTLRLSDSMHVALWVFGTWFVLTFILAFVAALAPCPRCGNYFHMHGMTLLYWRKCLHCQLHLCADRQGKTSSH
jgi:hypothetical protein